MSTVWTADLFPICREIEGIVFPGAAGTVTYGENGGRDSRDGGGNGSDNSNLFDHCFSFLSGGVTLIHLQYIPGM